MSLGLERKIDYVIKIALLYGSMLEYIKSGALYHQVLRKLAIIAMDFELLYCEFVTL